MCGARPVIILLWLIFFFPVALWLIWQHSGLPLAAKKVIIGAVAACVLVGSLYSLTPQGRAEQAAQDRADAQRDAQYQREATAREVSQKAQQAAAAKREAQSAPQSSSVYVTHANFGKNWPLTVNAAVVSHDQYDGVTLTINGIVYGVNGIARGEVIDPGRNNQPRYKDFNDSGYWAPETDPTYKGMGLGKDIGPIIDFGRRLPFASPQ